MNNSFSSLWQELEANKQEKPVTMQGICIVGSCLVTGQCKSAGGRVILGLFSVRTSQTIRSASITIAVYDSVKDS
jgi:predicted NUDIX family NTP pyrophosphohydrolase